MNNSRKILLGVSNSFCAHFLKGQVQYLVNNGFQVTIVSAPGEEIALLAKEEGAKLIPVAFSKRISILADAKILFRLIKIIKKEKPDIINAGNPKSGFLMMFAAWLVRHPNRIFTLHGLLSDTKTGLRRFLISNIEKWSYKFAHTTLVVSKSLQLHAIKRNIIQYKKSKVLLNGSANGVDTSIFTKSKYKQEAIQIAENLKLQKNKFTIGYVGRVSYDKGISHLLAAFLKLQKNNNIQLVIIGPLETEDKITKQDEAIIYNNPDIYYIGKVLFSAPYYHLFDVLVLPSFREGFGNVLIEAAAMEVPVIASNIAGIQDAVADNSNGFLIPPHNTIILIEKLLFFINNPNEKLKFGSNGNQFVTETFSQQNLWNEYLRFYNSLL
jgi:glycosyltransferase involved in cell wall biosynthesis